MVPPEGENEVVQHYSEPKFDDFEGKAVLDKHSNRVLNITIFNVRFNSNSLLIRKYELTPNSVEEEYQPRVRKRDKVLSIALAHC